MNFLFLIIITFFTTLFSCGGGNPPLPLDNAPIFLNWITPTQFEDNTYLDPMRDIGLYEIHTSDNASWGDCTVRAVVNPINNLGNLETNFNLRLLAVFGIGPGDNGTYIAMRSVGVDCVVSQFGKSCWWEAR